MVDCYLFFLLSELIKLSSVASTFNKKQNCFHDTMNNDIKNMISSILWYDYLKLKKVLHRERINKMKRQRMEQGKIFANHMW